MYVNSFKVSAFFILQSVWFRVGSDANEISPSLCVWVGAFFALVYLHSAGFKVYIIDIHQRSQNLRHLYSGMGLKLGVFGHFP